MSAVDVMFLKTSSALLWGSCGGQCHPADTHVSPCLFVGLSETVIYRPPGEGGVLVRGTRLAIIL